MIPLYRLPIAIPVWVVFIVLKVIAATASICLRTRVTADNAAMSL